MGVLAILLLNVLLGIGSRSMIASYEKKAVSQRAETVERQCRILAGRIQSEGIYSYSMKNGADEDGSRVNELEQFAGDIDGRVLLVDSSFKVLSDTYRAREGDYCVTEEMVSLFRGKEGKYRTVGDDYIQIPVIVYDAEGKEVTAVVLALASVREQNEMADYLREQRITVNGLFALLSVVAGVLLALLTANAFRRMQKNLDIVAEGHQDEAVSEDGYLEFHRLAVSFNRIINRYKELENSRQEFVSNVSHELKTPITSMKILADSLLMQENVPVEVYAEFMNDISHEIDREEQIINDLLTLVKMDKTQAELNIAPTNIGDLLEVLLKRISPIAQERDIAIRLETIRPVVAAVDEVKLSLACNNIIENAVKYNNDGGKVDVSLNADHKFFYIRVKDTGVGIPEEYQEQIFERFFRVDKARSRETGGTGLGLAISRNVVLMHKGSIRVHSREGEGTTFIIRIPLNYLG